MSTHPTLSAPALDAPDPARFAKAAEEALALRSRLEYHYRTAWRAKRELTEALQAAQQAETAWIEDTIGVCDVFEDLARTIEDNRRLRKQPEVREAARIALERVCELLERRNVFRVPVTGLRYHEVVFRGVPVPNPWEVVGTAKKTDGTAAGGVVREVLRSLWVRCDGPQVTLLRRASVIY